MSRLCDAYKCYGEKKISREWRFLEDIFLTKQLGIVSVRKKNTVKNAMTELQNLLLTCHHGLSSPGNLEQSGQRLHRTQIWKSTNKLKTWFNVKGWPGLTQGKEGSCFTAFKEYKSNDSSHNSVKFQGAVFTTSEN